MGDDRRRCCCGPVDPCPTSDIPFYSEPINWSYSEYEDPVTPRTDDFSNITRMFRVDWARLPILNVETVFLVNGVSGAFGLNEIRYLYGYQYATGPSVFLNASGGQNLGLLHRQIMRELQRWRNTPTGFQLDLPVNTDETSLRGPIITRSFDGSVIEMELFADGVIRQFNADECSHLSTTMGVVCNSLRRDPVTGSPFLFDETVDIGEPNDPGEIAGFCSVSVESTLTVTYQL